MNIKGIITSAALALSLSIPAAGLAKDFEEKICIEPYITAGTSTSPEHTSHSRAGITVSGKITENSSLGVDTSILWEGKDREECGAIKYTRRQNPYTFSLSAGISNIKLDTPVHWQGIEFYEETTDGAALYLETTFTREIIKGLSLRGSYQRSFAIPEVIDQYPENRFSIGLEGKLEF
jgi:hypothetical protein